MNMNLMLYELREFFEEIVVPVLLIFAFLFVFVALPVAWAANKHGEYQCENYAEISGNESRYAAFDTCYVKTNDGWQRWDEYLSRSVASEGLK